MERGQRDKKNCVTHSRRYSNVKLPSYVVARDRSRPNHTYVLRPRIQGPPSTHSKHETDPHSGSDKDLTSTPVKKGTISFKGMQVISTINSDKH